MNSVNGVRFSVVLEQKKTLFLAQNLNLVQEMVQLGDGLILNKDL